MLDLLILTFVSVLLKMFVKELYIADTCHIYAAQFFHQSLLIHYHSNTFLLVLSLSSEVHRVYSVFFFLNFLLQFFQQQSNYTEISLLEVPHLIPFSYAFFHLLLYCHIGFFFICISSINIKFLLRFNYSIFLSDLQIM